MRILEELWYGNVEPMEYSSFSNEKYKELLRLITKNEEKLQATFSDEQKELFSRYTDCVQEFQTISECLLFQNSFRLGARMMLEVMEE
ncbi:MAG: hypothetical protein MSA45_02895 [Firmicutes bacterium]|nr:hypothetical protein [Bacillota bacterium]